MNPISRLWTLCAAGILLIAGLAASAQDTLHFRFGRSESNGRDGVNAGLWWVDDEAGTSPINPLEPFVWLLMPTSFVPNGAGYLAAEFPTDVVYRIINGQARNVLSSTRVEMVYMTPGLQIYLGSDRIFSPDYSTLFGNQFSYPFSGAWHLHFNVYTFRPGTHDFQFKMTNTVSREGEALGDSPVYTVRYLNAPVLFGKAILDGWQRLDTSVDLTENRARVFLFPAGSTPIQETQAVATVDIFLDNSGNFLLPSSVVPNGNYRIGIKPLTAHGLAKLIPSDWFLSNASPATVPDIVIPLGDSNRDGAIDIADLLELIAHYNTRLGNANFRTNVDFNGDDSNDIGDLLLLIRNYNTTADFR